MLSYPNGGRLVTHLGELPALPERIENLYMDFETGSGNVEVDSLNPFRNSFICGVCITWDDERRAWYIPIGHHPEFAYSGNLDGAAVYEWLRNVFARTKRWVNHNIGYDALSLAAESRVHPESWAVNLSHISETINPVELGVELVCTLTTAKLLDSERQFKGGYGLDVLSADWLAEPITKYEDALKPYLDKGKGQKRGRDYAMIAADILGEYGCQDVLTNRKLYQLQNKTLPESCRGVWKTEIELTSVLVDMQLAGLAVSQTELQIDKLTTLYRLLDITESIKEKVGFEVRPHVSGDCKEILCGTYGLPVLAYTKSSKTKEETENPSFDRDTLKKYRAYADAPKDILEDMIEYRDLYKHLTGFLNPYLELHVDEILHGSINQCVRTGRMSMKKPNMQQLNKRAKRLIHPRPGNSFLSVDYSQIEFRLIVHYIKDEAAIAAYKADPWTDFHTWVAETCNIPRPAGKTLNFLLGYGGGKKKATQSLAGVKALIKRIQIRIDEMMQDGIIRGDKIDDTFQSMVREVATAAYETYHQKLPGLKITSKAAEKACKDKKYVFDFFGRRRHLSPQFAYKAFNTINQASAADLIKERTVVLARELRDTGLKVLLQVHDSILVEGPTERIRDPQTMNDVIHLMENPPYASRLRVPIKMAGGISESDWADADADANSVRIDSTGYGGFRHLKRLPLAEWWKTGKVVTV